ncbi:hypothetical protein AS29_006695 [Bacillus sp. SJS]|nr:hypothetical protein AS29_006695 [Bacillus sp. SJS]
MAKLKSGTVVIKVPPARYRDLTTPITLHVLENSFLIETTCRQKKGRIGQRAPRQNYDIICIIETE